MTYPLDKLVVGDIVGFSGKGLVSDAINVGTYALPRWGLSHVGIVCTHEGEKYLFESTTLNGDKSCAITGQPVSGVQAHPLEDILARPGKVWRYPLTTFVGPGQVDIMEHRLHAMLGLPYDYAGAGRSAGFFFRCLEGVLRREDLNNVFCSELVAFILDEIGIARIMNASAQSPNSLVRYLNRIKLYKKRERVK